MKRTSVKSDLLSIAEKLPDSAGYDEAMYELYVCKKIARGRQQANEGHLLTHEEVKNKLQRI